MEVRVLGLGYWGRGGGGPLLGGNGGRLKFVLRIGSGCFCYHM